jgi:hypothetical protein
LRRRSLPQPSSACPAEMLSPPGSGTGPRTARSCILRRSPPPCLLPGSTEEQAKFPGQRAPPLP